MSHGKARHRHVMHLAVGTEPVRAHLQGQVRVTADQAQGVGQVVAVDRGKGGFVAVNQSMHQERGIRRNRVARHQP